MSRPYHSGQTGLAVLAFIIALVALAISAYTYFHLPMVAGIIVSAVGDELTIAHPTGETGLATMAAILGGPALFLAGPALFKGAVFGVASASRPVAIVALAALAPIGLVVPPLALSAAATLVVASVALWDGRVHRSLAQPSGA